MYKYMKFYQLEEPQTKEPLTYYQQLYKLIEEGRNGILNNYSAHKLSQLGGVFSWGTFSMGIGEEIQELESTSKITICILTYQNIRNINTCLSVAKKMADRVIVVDSGSTDGTYEVALNMADKVIIVDNGIGFDEKRNIAIKNVETEWVFMLDTDETMSISGMKNLRKAITLADKYDIDVFWLSRFWLSPNHLSPFRYYVGHVFLWPDPQARLFRKEANMFYQDKLHEHVVSKGDHKQCLLGQADCALVHYKYFISSKKEREILLLNRKTYNDNGPDEIQLFPEKNGYYETKILNVELQPEVKKMLRLLGERELRE